MKHQKYARGKEKLVSVAMPTRGRMDLVKKSIDSILKTATNIDNVEILLRMDNDDKKMISKINELPFDKVDIFVIIGERFGYQNLQVYFNEMFGVSRGKWFALWNDDSIFKSEGWDSVLEEYGDSKVVLNPSTPGDRAEYLNTFPIVHRDIIEANGFLSLHANNDTWVSFLAQSLGIERVESKIKIFHDRADKTGNNDDQVWKDRSKVWQKTREKLDSAEYVQLRNEAAMNVAGALGK